MNNKSEDIISFSVVGSMVAPATMSQKVEIVYPNFFLLKNANVVLTLAFFVNYLFYRVMFFYPFYHLLFSFVLVIIFNIARVNDMSDNRFKIFF